MRSVREPFCARWVERARVEIRRKNTYDRAIVNTGFSPTLPSFWPPYVAHESRAAAALPSIGELRIRGEVSDFEAGFSRFEISHELRCAELMLHLSPPRPP